MNTYRVLVIMGNLKGYHYRRANYAKAAFDSVRREFSTPRYPGDPCLIQNPTCLFGEAELVEDRGEV